MAPISIPDAPKHLDKKAKKQWEDKYVAALKQAQIDHPDNESTQRAAATKEANKMLAVPAPETAEDIDKLADWQVLVRETRTNKEGSEVRHCVTTDGRKYAHVIEKKKKVSDSTSTPAA